LRPEIRSVILRSGAVDRRAAEPDAGAEGNT